MCLSLLSLCLVISQSVPLVSSYVCGLSWIWIGCWWKVVWFSSDGFCVQTASLQLCFQHWTDDVVSRSFWFSLCLSNFPPLTLSLLCFPLPPGLRVSHIPLFIFLPIIVLSFWHCVNAHNAMTFPFSSNWAGSISPILKSILIPIDYSFRCLLSFTITWNELKNLIIYYCRGHLEVLWDIIYLPHIHPSPCLSIRCENHWHQSSVSVTMAVQWAAGLQQHNGTAGWDAWCVGGPHQPRAGGREPFLIPALFSGRLPLLNQHRVNQQISLFPSGSSIRQFAAGSFVCLQVYYGSGPKTLLPHRPVSC